MNKIIVYIMILIPAITQAQYDPYEKMKDQRLEVMRRELAEEYYKTEILRQRQEQNKLEYQAQIRNQQIETYREDYQYTKDNHRYENNYNNINNINQSANTLYNVASQLKNISNLLK